MTALLIGLGIAVGAVIAFAAGYAFRDFEKEYKVDERERWRMR